MRETSQPLSRRDEQVSIARFPDLKHQSVRQPFLQRVAAAALAEIQKPDIVEANPNTAPVVLEYGVRLIAGQSLAFSIGREDIAAPAAQPAIRPDPQISFTILQQTAHHQSAICARRGYETPML